MKPIHLMCLAGLAGAWALAGCTAAEDGAPVGTRVSQLGPPGQAEAVVPDCADGQCWRAPQHGEWDRPGSGSEPGANADPGNAGGNGGGPSRCADDDLEENDDPGAATPMPLVYLGSSWASFDLPTGLHLCGGDDDWFEADMLDNEDLGDWGTGYVFVRARVAGVGLCGASCGEPVLPEAPENTMTVELYARSTGELIASRTSTRGNVWITHGHRAYTDNFYIRVYGPPEASYDYVLHMDVREGLFEDECEC